MAIVQGQDRAAGPAAEGFTGDEIGFGAEDVRVDSRRRIHQVITVGETTLGHRWKPCTRCVVEFFHRAGQALHRLGVAVPRTHPGRDRAVAFWAGRRPAPHLDEIGQIYHSPGNASGTFTPKSWPSCATHLVLTRRATISTNPAHPASPVVIKDLVCGSLSQPGRPLRLRSMRSR